MTVERFVDSNNVVRISGRLVPAPSGGGFNAQAVRLASCGILDEPFDLPNSNNNANLAFGNLSGCLVALEAGQPVTGLLAWLAVDAQGTPSSGLFASLYKLDGTLVATSPDDAAAIIGTAADFFPFNFAAPIAAPATASYYATLLQADAYGTQDPTFAGSENNVPTAAFPSGNMLGVVMAGQATPPAAAVFSPTNTFPWLAPY